LSIAATVYEDASALITGVLKDTATDTGIQPETLLVSIYDRDTEQVLLPESGLTPVSTYVDSSGNLTYYISAAYNTIVNDGKQHETHVIRFGWTWTAQGATQTATTELQFNVINLSFTP